MSTFTQNCKMIALKLQIHHQKFPVNIVYRKQPQSGRTRLRVVTTVFNLLYSRMCS